MKKKTPISININVIIKQYLHSTFPINKIKK